MLPVTVRLRDVVWGEGKSVDCEYNIAFMVHHNIGVEDARKLRFCARLSIIAGSCGREEPSERVTLCKTRQLRWDGAP